VGVASLTPEPCRTDPQALDWQLRGMATAEEVQGQGIGTALMAECFGRVRERGGRRVWCNGRTTALRFYERLGFRTSGDEFHHPLTGPHFVLIADL